MADRCTSTYPLPKSTVLAYTRPNPDPNPEVGELVQYVDDTGYTVETYVVRLGTGTVGVTVNGDVVDVPAAQIRLLRPVSFYDKVPYNNWSVTSFDPKSRAACVLVRNPFVQVMTSIQINPPGGKFR